MLSGHLSRLLISLLLALSILNLAKRFPLSSLSEGRYFLALLLLSLLHFRSAVFFYWDEWDVLLLFCERGARSILQAHNEHFMPLYLLLFYLQKLIFADRYLLYILSSLALHALNAYLLSRLFNLLFQNLPSRRSVSRWLAIVFLLSSLHIEVLQWAFTLQIELSFSFVLLGALALFSFLASRRVLLLLALFLCSLGAAFSFANGYVLLLLLLLLFIFRTFVMSTAFSLKSFNPSYLMRSSQAFLIILLGSALAFSLRTQFALDVSTPPPVFQHHTEFGIFLFVGTHFGVMLRGLSLFPSLSFFAPRQLLDSWHLLFPPEIALSLLALFFSLLLLLFYLRPSMRRERAVHYWILGELWLIFTFLLPALGRWNFGILAALSLRYAYFSLPGVLFILAPLLSRLHAYLHRESRSLALSALIKFAFLSFFTVQLFLATTSDLSALGAKHRLYQKKLSSWVQMLKEEGIDQVKNFSAAGTALAGLAPEQPKTLTPIVPAQEVYQVLHCLNPQRYPNL